MAQRGVDLLVAVQGDASYFVKGSVEAGMAAARAHFFPTTEEAGQFCRRITESGDVILVKGSRGVYLEKLIELLRSGEVSASEAGASTRSGAHDHGIADK